MSNRVPLALGVTFTLLVLVFLLFVREDATPGAGNSPTPSPSVLGSAPSATGQPSPSAVARTEWRTLATIPGPVSSVVESYLGWFAIGTTPGGPTQLFTSTHGIAWQAADAGPLRGGYRIWEGGPQLTVAGTTADIDFGTPLLWFSADGLEWTESNPIDDGRFGAINDVVQLEGAILAVGQIGPSVDPDDDQAVVWLTGDLTTWSETPLGGSYVARGFADRLVLVGGAGGPRFSGPELEPRRGAAWYSSNWPDWTAQPADPDLQSALITDAIAPARGLVAVGAQWDDDASTGTPAIWGFTDAAGWTLDWVGTCCGEFRAVAEFAADLIAVAGMTDRTAVAYRSTDGVAWEHDGALEGFVGEVHGFAMTQSFGPILIGQTGPAETLLLLPPSE